MILPLSPALAGSRSRWRRGGAAVLLLVMLHVGGSPGRGQEADPFSATVKVDATADSIVKAREMARIDGQRRALAVIAERLSGDTPVKLPKFSDRTITDLVRSFEVANERMSAVRYLADYTFHFRSAETRRAFADAGIGIDAGATPGKPIVLLPVYQADGLRLWDDPNPWRDSWDRRPPAESGNIIVPLGDAGDLAAIDAEQARAGNAEALATVIRRNGGGEAVVALAKLRGADDRPLGLEVTLRRYRHGQPVASRSEEFSAGPGESTDALLRRAVAAIASNIGSGWSTEAADRQQDEGSLTAVLPISSLEDWLRARERLGSVPAVRKLDLLSLSRQEATIEIGYSGTIDALRSELARISLELLPGEKLWRLARTGPGGAP